MSKIPSGRQLVMMVCSSSLIFLISPICKKSFFFLISDSQQMKHMKRT